MNKKETNPKKKQDGNGTFLISNGMTNTQTPQKQNDDKKENLKDSVLSRIENEQVCPKSKWFFRCSRSGVWALWVVTVVVGAIAVSEAIYISMHAGFEYYEMTHGTFADFVLDSLPIIWLLAFGGMVFFAYYNLRMTPRGYRYPLWQVIVSSLVFTTGGGVVLHAAGVSTEIDRMMSGHMPGYLSVEERQEFLWEHPEAGRIIGRFTGETEYENVIRFTDLADREWTVEVHELPSRDRSLLYSGEKVRLIGESGSEEQILRFYGCGVLPWMSSKKQSVTSIRELRREGLAMIKQYEDAFGVEAEDVQPSMRCREIMQVVMRRNI